MAEEETYRVLIEIREELRKHTKLLERLVNGVRGGQDEVAKDHNLTALIDVVRDIKDRLPGG